MISSIKTPGVYVHEINGFPPSIAQVATAIPAFVGYTQKGPTEPVKVTSLLEYQEHFGGPPKPAGLTVNLNTEYSVSESQFKLYNSLRLFFANGGGECYIVSVGHYEDTNPFDDANIFNNGLDLVEKVDEVTLLLFPDAVNLSAANLGLVQKHALKQCSELMDRFVIMDTRQVPADGLDDDALNFRDNIGNQHLKYGAAYYPYLQTNFGYNFRFNDINGTGPGKVDFKTLYSSDQDIDESLSNFETLYNDIHDNGILKAWQDAQSNNPKVEVTADADVANSIANIFGLMGTVGDPESSISHTGLKNMVEDMISISLKPLVQKLVNFNAAYDGLVVEGGADSTTTAADLSDAGIGNDFNTTVWGDFTGADYTPPADNPYKSLIENSNTPGDVNFLKAKAQLDKLFGQVNTTMNALIDSVHDFELKEENDLTAQLPIYPSIISELNKNMNTVPPSGAVAGIYANVDANRGVWKAPANVSVNGIIGLTDDITHKEQSTMNVHSSGKSINAIRKFTGKGLLVWGARTLDGNSNDWRYINVRRLANMIQESTKKACMNFVFEPNVKQTWVNVKGMIENYLTTLWRDGALAGAKPEDAFFVSVGLNETMSAQDINEGRLIVKIGYAPSRPAEFIVLEFTQIQQKS